MPEYTFKNLSPLDFEVLIRDLLQKHLNIFLESFKPGRDSGIDFRGYTDKSKKIIIQCKHYANTTFSGLISDIRKKEVPKVVKLKPDRYIFATSLGLTPSNKDDIVEAFSPFIKETKDVLGRDDINNLLELFPEIEKQQIKLWISSSDILEQMINSTLHNISIMELERIKENAKLFVKSEAFEMALQKLRDHHCCIIAGEPGIGKTILAEMLCLYLVDRNFELVKVTTDIKEAHSGSHKRKRIVYYDDFLGQTSLDQKFEKNEDQTLIQYIDRIHKSDTNYLIMTTREYILKQAYQLYERFARIDLKPDMFILNIGHYNRMIRAQILYNHIFYSDLPQGKISAILTDRSYLRIIDHKNYNPRIVEFITTSSRTSQAPANKFIDHIISLFDNPSLIWEPAFINQISETAQKILLLSATFGIEANINDLRKAVSKYDNHFDKTGQKAISEISFKKALKELDGTFFKIMKIGTIAKTEIHAIRFANPSIRDFIEKYIFDNSDIARTILNSSIFFGQIEWFWDKFLLNENKLLISFNKIKRSNEERIFIDLFRQEYSNLARIFINTFDSKETKFRRYDTKYFGEILQRKDTSLGHRFSIILEIIESISQPTLNNCPNDLLSLIFHQLSLELIDASQIIEIIPVIRSYSKYFDSESENRLLAGLEKCYLSPEEYNELYTILKSMHNEKDGLSWIKKFKQKIIKELKGSFYSIGSDDPEVYQDEADSLHNVSENFDVDLTRLIFRFEEEAEEKRSQYPEMGGDDNWNRGSSHSHSERETHSDNDIDSLFNTLNR